MAKFKEGDKVMFIPTCGSLRWKPKVFFGKIVSQIINGCSYIIHEGHYAISCKNDYEIDFFIPTSHIYLRSRKNVDQIPLLKVIKKDLDRKIKLKKKEIIEMEDSFDIIDSRLDKIRK